MENIAISRLVNVKDRLQIQKDLCFLEKLVTPLATILLVAVNRCHPALSNSYSNCLRMTLAMSSSISQEQTRVLEIYNDILESFEAEGKT